MKYFTPELFVRLQECATAEDFSAVNADWERAARSYGAALEQATPRLSRELQRFVRWGSMHDAQVLEIGTTQRCLTMVLLQEKAPRLVTLTYSLVDTPVIDRTALPPEHRSLPTLWLYDEIERDPEMLYNPRLRIQKRASALDGTTPGEADWRPIFLHSILLSNGWEMRLRFHRITTSRTNSLLLLDEPACRDEKTLSPTA
jgi:hypothetical protein